MKKIIAVILFCCLAAGCTVQTKNNNTMISVKESVVDNRYNNSCAGTGVKLIQIGDKLYYNYNNSDSINYGTYEISSNECRRIHWNGVQENPVNLSLEYFYKNKIFNDSIINDIGEEEYYDVETESFKPCNLIPNFKSPDGLSYYRFFAGDDIYCATDKTIYKSLGDNQYTVFAAKDDLNCEELASLPEPFYIQGKYLYYETLIKDDFYLCRYDTENKKIVNKIPYTSLINESMPDATYGLSMNKLIADSDNVYLVLDGHALLFFDLVNNSVEKITDPNSTLCMNYYNNTLYYGVMHEKNSGLYRVDCSKMSKAEKIYDKGVCSIYILDDEYVYFTDFDENLYRIKNDTKKVEVVFSIQNK